MWPECSISPVRRCLPLQGASPSKTKWRSIGCTGVEENTFTGDKRSSESKRPLCLNKPPTSQRCSETVVRRRQWQWVTTLILCLDMESNFVRDRHLYFNLQQSLGWPVGACVSAGIRLSGRLHRTVLHHQRCGVDAQLLSRVGAVACSGLVMAPAGATRWSFGAFIAVGCLGGATGLGGGFLLLWWRTSLTERGRPEWGRPNSRSLEISTGLHNGVYY